MRNKTQTMFGNMVQVLEEWLNVGQNTADTQ